MSDLMSTAKQQIAMYEQGFAEGVLEGLKYANSGSVSGELYFEAMYVITKSENNAKYWCDIFELEVHPNVLHFYGVD